MAKNTDAYQFFNRSQQIKDLYFEVDIIIYAQGICGNLEVLPLQRPCTPPLHVHLKQTEYFTVIQGTLGYQIGDKTYSCDMHTCPRPLVIPPRVSHTFWMGNNKEDLIVRVRIEPFDKHGLRQEFFENFAGVFRDQYVSIWQLSMFFDDAQVYPAVLPQPWVKILVKFGSLMGRLLGYKLHYEEYTTIFEELN